MSESVLSLTLSARRYAHALLGRWPVAEGVAGGRRRADQDADDLAHQGLLSFWRAGLLSCEELAEQPPGALRLALLRRLTRMAGELVRNAGAAGYDRQAAGGGGDRRFARHFPWAPEALALPRLPFESRAVLALAALERLDYDAIGLVLDMSAAQALARLARARAELTSALSGRRQPHLRAAAHMCESDLHGYADGVLAPERRAEVEGWLERDAEAARRVAQWRRDGERLRGAFATLDAEPLPAILNFRPPVLAARRNPSARKLWRRWWSAVLDGFRPAVAAR